MILTEKERTVIEDLQTQEKGLVEKYHRCGSEAKDPVLQDLFGELEKMQQKHYDTLGQVLTGAVPTCDCNCSAGADYAPRATYTGMSETADKKNDCFLATDCIGSEKLAATEYNTNVFNFQEPEVRKLLADIQIEEQNYAEMLYKYKTVNSMQ
ncbi:MAG: ferritin-like domain-containing protein [Eubacterium sp.]|nr:ferritin-like domain-containing protein [Eubacterium sp.]